MLHVWQQTQQNQWALFRSVALLKQLLQPDLFIQLPNSYAMQLFFVIQINILFTSLNPLKTIEFMKTEGIPLPSLFVF